MFENLTERLGRTLKNLRGQGRLTEDNIKEALRDVRMALLEADVALPVVREFIEHVRERAVGKDVLESLTPGQAMIGVVRDELVTLRGAGNDDLQRITTPPAVVLMAGLQGAGKTTTVAKLARFLKERRKKSVMVASCDVYRPAAIEQLQTLAKEVGAAVFPSSAACRRLISPIISASTCNRPAVSISKTSTTCLRAASTPACAMATGSCSALLGKNAAPTSLARVCNCSMAAGR